MDKLSVPGWYVEGQGQEGRRSDPLVPRQPCPGPCRGCGKSSEEHGSGQALEKRNRRGRAGPGCEGPAVEVAEVAETGHPLRGQPRPFSLSEWSLGSAGLSEAMWACDLWVMGAGSPPGTLFNEELSPPLVKSGQCQEVGDAGAAGGAGGLQARPAF